MFKFTRDIDMTREVPELVRKEDLYCRLEKFFASGTRITSRRCPQLSALELLVRRYVFLLWFILIE